MAGAPNPLIASLLMRQLAGGGGPGGPAPGGPPGGAPSPGALAMGAGAPPTGGPMAGGGPAGGAASSGFGRELSSLRQADPMAIAAAIRDIRMKVSSMINDTSGSIPGVSRSLAKTLQGLDAATKEAQMALSTMQVASPIQASAAQGAPGMGAPSPSPSMGGM